MLKRREKKKVGVRHLVMLVILALLGFFGYSKYAGMNLEKANAHLAAGEYNEAEVFFQKVASLPLSKGKGMDGLGVIDLLMDDMGAAREHFKVVLENKPGGYGGDPNVILQTFNKKGMSERAKIYVDFLKNWRGEDDLKPLALDLAYVGLANRNLDDAKLWMGRVTPPVKQTERYIQLEKRVTDYERKGQIPIMVDREGNTILFWDLKANSYAFASAKVFAGWAEDGQSPVAALPKNLGQNLIQTSLDLSLQKAAHQAMNGYQGTMIMADPTTGEVLAAYGTENYHPFSFAFEPGSVIKMLTYGFFLEDGGDVTPYAPKNYPSYVTIGGKIFYDWTTQGRLNSIDEGMAVSCNLMFAQMGIDLSLKKWKEQVVRLFPGSPENGFLGNATYGELLRDPENAWELGRGAIGLDHLSTTSLGLVQIPLAIANKGSLMKPHLIREVVSYDDQVIQKTKPVSDRFFAEHVAEKLMSSFEKSVYFNKGTARRAKVDFVTSGMKTGTSGERPFNSVMVGAFPVNNPKVAFAFVLHNGGKCEINGGRVAKRLQEQIKALAPEYLE